MKEVFACISIERKIKMEECKVLDCEYNEEGGCSCCDDYRNADKGKDCTSYINENEGMETIN